MYLSTNISWLLSYETPHVSLPHKPKQLVLIMISVVCIYPKTFHNFYPTFILRNPISISPSKVKTTLSLIMISVVCISPKTFHDFWPTKPHMDLSLKSQNNQSPSNPLPGFSLYLRMSLLHYSRPFNNSVSLYPFIPKWYIILSLNVTKMKITMSFMFTRNEIAATKIQTPTREDF